MSSQIFQNINERAGCYSKYLERDVWGFDMVIEQDYVNLSGEKEFFDKYGLYWKEALPLREGKIFHKT